MFKQLLEYAENNLHIIGVADKGSPYTQFVLGEMHFHPKVQSEVLKTLVDLRDIGISFFGKEVGQVKKLESVTETNLQIAVNDPSRMRKAIELGMDAKILFASAFDDIAFEKVDDPKIKEMVGTIDDKCHELFLVKKRVGWEGMSVQEKEDYELWFSLLKHVLLFYRSNAFVNNLLRMQGGYGKKTAALICGAGHTPLIKEHAPYSVVSALESARVNYIIAVPYTVKDFLEYREPFDFYSKSDESEVSPYEK